MIRNGPKTTLPGKSVAKENSPDILKNKVTAREGHFRKAGVEGSNPSIGCASKSACQDALHLPVWPPTAGGIDLAPQAVAHEEEATV